MERVDGKPILNLDQAEKFGAYAALFPLILDTLQAYHPEVVLSADDIFDFCALCMASILDNDTNLKTPRDLRLGAQSATAYIDNWTKTLRGMRTGNESTLLGHVLDEDRKSRTLG